METQLQKDVINEINANINHIKKYHFEKINDKYFIDIILNNTILNIIVDNQIKVNLDESINKYLIDFYRNEKLFININDFKEFLNTVVNGYLEKTSGLFVRYNDEDFICEIEVNSIDADRQMGTETFYSLFFTDNDGDEVIVAEVSEYPIGIFEVFDINEEVEILESEIKEYFEDKYHSQE